MTTAGRNALTTTVVALAATLAFASSAGAVVTPDADSNLATWDSIPQWVSPWPVGVDDQTYTLTPNSTQTFVTPVPQMGPNKAKYTIILPCEGFDIQGPGIDIAAGDVRYYGFIGQLHDLDHIPTGAVQDPDGNWEIPESFATVTPYQDKAGELCRKIGWAETISNPTAAADPQLAQAARTARHGKRSVRVKPRAPKGRYARRANHGAANPLVTVTTAGMHFSAQDGLNLVIRITTGDLPGPTTLYTHARVLLQQ